MTTEAPGDLRERMTGYIRHNAAKSDDAIRDIVQKGHELLMEGMADLSAEQATFKPSAEEWSVLEIMTHIIEVKIGITQTCEALARGELPESASNEVEAARVRDGFSGRPFASPAEASEAAVKAHQALVVFVNGLSDETDNHKKHEHPFVGPMNCREWAVFQRIHDGDHAQQIGKIRADEGFPA